MIENEKIQAILQKEHKDQPTLIQKQTYDAIKNGASVVALAKTGTGKTLAYALPALERLQPGEKNALVILAPTTELAVQIRNAIQPFAKALGLKTLALVGAGNRQRQDERLKKETNEVLVCTPGRFFDFFSSGRIKLGQIKSLVIDEADDILEFAKLDLLSSLGQNLPSSSQILLFGATESQITREAEEIFARHFLLIDVRPDQSSQTEHLFLQVDNEHKLEYLQRLCKLDGFRGLLFFDSNETMLRFAKIFAHSKTKFAILANNFSKDKRQQAIRDLAKGKVKLLLATDLAARGLDIPKLTYVVNYEIPEDANTYMHRAGRTGRMQRQGRVVTLGNDHDLRKLKKLLAGEASVDRVYFAGYHLSKDKPVKKAKEDKKAAVLEAGKKKKKSRKKNKNKGYHPHYLKGKKQSD
ncbi:helicase [Lactobacillus nasalidis]|uniref:Helicase n=1 Tax=Lactobacillus nasalidis TaxID=2797258 RepID=A0ABQ3WB36_9LACO|nr:DEAD/DEAH box helicase [Lactobacillus nasalidis]GHV97258.1 helicase [Lactobacillus nasalidis]GHV99420.1 helicase [Lactobacillus nasalidis]GHW02102.1 helicase [Lactobacillus nasalidis]